MAILYLESTKVPVANNVLWNTFKTSGVVFSSLLSTNVFDFIFYV